MRIIIIYAFWKGGIGVKEIKWKRRKKADSRQDDNNSDDWPLVMYFCLVL
jgi:hypothetical protein